MNGYVTFVMDGRELAGRLDEVREVVRATGVEPLTGARAPVTGLLVLRGTPVPVVDLRGEPDPGEAGDVLVLQTGDGVLGLAVDRVLAVLGPDELAPVAGSTGGLPAYVLEVRRSATGSPVFVVSLRALAGLVPA
jgi:chemotaxis signal transduction protein